MKKLLITIICLIIFILYYDLSFAQSPKIDEPIFNDNKSTSGNISFNEYISTQFADSIINDKDLLCKNGCFFIRFKISEYGNPMDVRFNKNTPKELTVKIKQIIERSGKYWTPRKINNVPFESNYFLLPVYYQFWDNCTSENSGKKNDDFSSVYNLLDFGDLSEPDPKIPHFKGPYKSDPLDCRILNTVYLISLNYPETKKYTIKSERKKVK